MQFASCHAATDLRLNCFLLPTLLSPSLSSPLSLCLSSLALTCWCCCCCGCCCGCSKANGANSCPYSLLLLLLALFRLLANTSNAPRPPTSELASETGAAEPRLWCRKLRELRPKNARCQTELELDVAEARPSNRARAAHNGMLLIFGQLVAPPQHGQRLHRPGASCKRRRANQTRRLIKMQQQMAKWQFELTDATVGCFLCPPQDIQCGLAAH